MKKSILFVLFALISVAGFSQITGWNAKVGMNFSNYTGDLDMNAKVGFKLGGGFEYAFDDTFGWTIRFGRCTEVGQSEEYELFYCCRI